MRSQWRKDTQLKVGTELLSALQARVKAINDLAYLADKNNGDGERVWSAQTAAATEWNNARHAALVVSPPEVAALLQRLDEQSDSLLAQAMTKQWTLGEFRKERDSLGRLAANYLDAVRAATGWPPLQLKSLWTWKRAEEPPGVTSPAAVQAIEDQSGR
jgi:hypothetical protein